MNKPIFFFIFFTLFPVAFAFSQQQTFRFETTTFDFGAVNQWNNPPAVFLFTNKGTAEAMFLPIFPRDDIFAELPKSKIKPGATDTVFVYYFTSALGEFQKSIELYSSASGSPIKLTVKGNILSLAPDALISCPGFAPKTSRTDDLALVLDTLSRPKPIVQAVNEIEVMQFEEPDEKPMPPVLQTEITGTLPLNQFAPNNIVFLIDVSSSMNKPDKLPLLKESMKSLAHELRKVDYITVITYSSNTQVRLEPTIADRKREIITMIDTLTSEGLTHGVKGLQTAYDFAEKNFITDGNNQVIIATDGLFSPGYSENDMFKLVGEQSRKGIILSVVGFGKDENAFKMMKKMAVRGKGNFIHIPDAQSAKEHLIVEIKFQSAIAKQ